MGESAQELPTTQPAVPWRLRLTGDLLDLVDHHKGIRQAHLHRVVHGADLRHLDRNLKQKNTMFFPVIESVSSSKENLGIGFHHSFPYWFNLDLGWIK